MNTRRWLITVFACLIVLGTLAGYKFLQIKAAIAFGESFPEPSESVEALVATESPMESHIATIGEVVAPESVELRNELEGRVSAINMVSGSHVVKGDILLQLDISEESARLKAAQASANLAELKLRRMEKLLPNNTVSQDNVDQAQAEYDIASANVNQLQAIIAKKTLRAPFDATVGLHDIDMGEFIEANSALVTLLGTRGYLWVDFNLPLSQASVQTGDTVLIVIPATGEKLSAQVVASNPALSQQSRNLRYRAKVEANAGLTPNSVVNVLVPGGTGQHIQLPSPAVQRDDMGAYVFVLVKEAQGDGYRANRRGVVLGGKDGDTASVVSGIEAGDLIATHGAFKLRDSALAYVRQRPQPKDDAVPGSVEEE